MRSPTSHQDLNCEEWELTLNLAHVEEGEVANKGNRDREKECLNVEVSAGARHAHFLHGRKFLLELWRRNARRNAANMKGNERNRKCPGQERRESKRARKKIGKSASDVCWCCLVLTDECWGIDESCRESGLRIKTWYYRDIDWDRTQNKNIVLLWFLARPKNFVATTGTILATTVTFAHLSKQGKHLQKFWAQLNLDTTFNE